MVKTRGASISTIPSVFPTACFKLQHIGKFLFGIGRLWTIFFRKCIKKKNSGIRLTEYPTLPSDQIVFKFQNAQQNWKWFSVGPWWRAAAYDHLDLGGHSPPHRWSRRCRWQRHLPRCHSQSQFPSSLIINRSNPEKSTSLIINRRIWDWKLPS